MQKVRDILNRFDPTSGKYVSREFQSFGLYIAQKLGDEQRKTLYIKMAKTVPRYILEKALAFVMDAHARNRGALFMWKVGELKKTKHAR